MKRYNYILPKIDIMKRYIIILSLFIAFGSLALQAQVINPPTELEAEFENGSYVKVKWDDNSSNEDGFLIERSLYGDSLHWEIVGQVYTNVDIFLDYWILLNRLYIYRVYAYNSTGTSGYSNTDTARTFGDTTNIPLNPTNLRATKVTPTSITVMWDDNSSNEFGFIIARKRPELPYFEFIDSVGTDVLTYQEVGLTPDNTYFYKVCAYNQFGISDYTNTVSARTEEGTIIRTNTQSADDFYLSNNYPNPFNPSTKIEFGVRISSEVSLKVYDSRGNLVETLFDGRLPEGSYIHQWNASGLSSGVYFCRMTATGKTSGFFSETMKMILAR